MGVLKQKLDATDTFHVSTTCICVAQFYYHTMLQLFKCNIKNRNVYTVIKHVCS